MGMSFVAELVGSFYAEVLDSLHPVFYPFIPYWTLVLTALAVSPLTILLPQLLQGKLSWPSREDAPDVWFIHGKTYNLRPFFRHHPGGSFVLRAAKGSDCTGLVESYHPFFDRDVLFKMMEAFVVEGAPEAPKPQVEFVDPFYTELKQAVRRYFQGKGKGAHKMTWPHLFLCLLAWCLMWLVTGVMLTRGSMWCIPAISFLAWYVASNVGHDASHSALVTRPWLNRALVHSSFPFGLNWASWHIQHVMSHHIYTNGESDVDLYHFDPVITLQKGVGRVHIVLHCIRLVYILSTAIPHLAIVVPYNLLFGQVDPAHGHQMYDRIKGIRSHRAELKWHILGEMIPLFVFFGVGYSYMGFTRFLCYQMSIYTLTSYLFCFFTQVSHLQEECFEEPGKPAQLSFAKQQVASSMDFAPHSRFWGHVSGGLNTQALHHCFPSVSAMHLRELYPIFRQVCRDHGVLLKEAPSMAAFVHGFIQFAN